VADWVVQSGDVQLAREYQAMLAVRFASDGAADRWDPDALLEAVMRARKRATVPSRDQVFGALPPLNPRTP
jgi:hypothetical protein